jgi:hypothetical protein
MEPGEAGEAEAEFVANGLTKDESPVTDTMKRVETQRGSTAHFPLITHMRTYTLQGLRPGTERSESCGRERCERTRTRWTQSRRGCYARLLAVRFYLANSSHSG